MFKNAKVGDNVWDTTLGGGIITDINKSATYPIMVRIRKSQISKNYTFGGYNDIDHINPSLFWQEFEIPKEAFKKPLPNLATDTKVIVWLDGGVKCKRHFKRFNENGKIVTFTKGGTSWTSTISDETAWDNWELVDEN